MTLRTFVRDSGAFFTLTVAILFQNGECMLLPMSRSSSPRSSLVWLQKHPFGHLLPYMLPLKSRESPDQTITPPSSSLQLGLELWELGDFPFDMSGERRDSNDHERSQDRPRGHSNSFPSVNTSGSNTTSSGLSQSDYQNAAFLAQLAAIGAFQPQGVGGPSPHSSPTYGNLVSPTGDSNPAPSIHHGGYPDQGRMDNVQLPPFSSLNFAWHQASQHPYTAFQAMHQPNVVASPVPYTGVPGEPFNVQTPGASSSRATRRNSIQQGSSPAASSADPDGQSEAERTIIAEEKRRRNTEASARFRIKKKQRTVNLERSVSDLTGRAEDLEREVADLRRENGWLKEIVMLKGSRLAGMNLIDHMAPERGFGSSSQTRSSGQRPEGRREGDDSDEHKEEEEGDKDQKDEQPGTGRK